jgi:hypothetical protein
MYGRDVNQAPPVDRYRSVGHRAAIVCRRQVRSIAFSQERTNRCVKA